MALRLRRPQNPRRGRAARWSSTSARAAAKSPRSPRARSRNLDYIVPVWTSPERERLVERLTRWTPAGLTRFFFTSGGSEAVEAALKFAILYHKARGKRSKNKIIGRRFSYHGNTIAALSAGGSGRRADYEHVLLDWPKIDPTYCYRCPWGKTYPSCDLDCADRARKRDPQARRRLDRRVYRRADDGLERRRRCRRSRSTGRRFARSATRYDVLLIADEVMTGFGRTGRRFGVDHWDVVPDILIGGKGLTGGYMPMGMIAVKESLVEEVEQRQGRLHVLHLQLASAGVRGRRRGARNHGARAAGRALGGSRRAARRAA